MKKNIMKKYLGDSLMVKPKFKDFIEKNNIVFEKAKGDKLIRIFNNSKIRLVLYTLFILAIGVFSTLFISNFYTDKSTGDISPTKNVELLLDEGKIDKFIAFGPDRATNLFTSDLILKSNIISDSDKDVLRNYEKNEYPNLFYNLYFGIKDGKDVVCLHHLGKPYNIIVFESDLDYSFQSIVEEFELQSGITLSDDFLNSSELDSMNKQMGGIVISFNEVDSIFEPFFIAFIDGKTYLVSK